MSDTTLGVLGLLGVALAVCWPFVQQWRARRTPCLHCGHMVAEHIGNELSCLGDPPGGGLFCGCHEVVRSPSRWARLRQRRSRPPTAEGGAPPAH